MRLVPGRECGECTVCCVTPALYTKEYKKAPGIRCKHLCAVGCSIYPTRYTPCRDYYCGWRYLDFLNDDWRPDKCGVALSTEPKEMVPPPYELGMVFKLDSEPPFAFRRPLFEYVAFLIAANKVRVTLVVSGPPGFYPVETYLNDVLKDAASNGDLAAIETVFFKALELRSTEPHLFKRELAV